MDLMNLLRSVEALLYEIVSWLVFYPLTLWRCVVRPVEMAIYAEKELTDPPDQQFEGALSPPLFLFLTLLLAHGLQATFGTSQAEIQGVLADLRSGLLFQAVIFSLFPLLFAIQRVKQNGQDITRSSLRPAFYGQCYMVVPFALSVEIALVVFQTSRISGAVILLVAIVWYLACLTRWSTYHGVSSAPKASARALGTLILGVLGFLAIVVVVALAILQG